MKRCAMAAVVLSFALTGCGPIVKNLPNADQLAADAPIHSGQATIHVLRDSGRVQAMYAFPVMLDKAKVGSIRRERYLVFSAAPGPHTVTVACPFSCQMRAHEVKFTASPGKSYYFRFASDLTIDGFVGNMMKITTRTGLNQIDRVEADQLMAVYEPGKSTE